MNDIVVDYPWKTFPDLAKTQEVVTGIHWLRLPLPIQLNHINVYLLEDDDGLVIFDTGFNVEQLRLIWDEVLTRFPLGKRPRILCSHYHPDHFGLVGHLCEKYDFELIMSQTDWLIANLLSSKDNQQSRDMQLAFYRHNGMDEKALQRHQNRGGHFRDACSGAPASYSRISQGDTLQVGGRIWQVITAAGHTPEQVCLHCAEDKILLSADHILPRITPNTSIFAYNPGTNPLAEFIDSFGAFSAVDDETLTLPCHDLPFKGVQKRIRQLVDHHEERLEELLALCVQPKHAFELIAPMFSREMDPHQEMFALGEILAHLRLLESRGLATSSIEGGVERFCQNTTENSSN